MQLISQTNQLLFSTAHGGGCTVIYQRMPQAASGERRRNAPTAVRSPSLMLWAAAFWQWQSILLAIWVYGSTRLITRDMRRCFPPDIPGGQAFPFADFNIGIGVVYPCKLLGIAVLVSNSQVPANRLGPEGTGHCLGLGDCHWALRP